MNSNNNQNPYELLRQRRNEVAKEVDRHGSTQLTTSQRRV